MTAPPTLGQRPWLDGMRAVAVLSVVAYHEQLFVPRFHVPWFGPGGDMGVDVFFVISGFLITTLLLEERARTGRIDLGAFYGRRARRLLPAVAVVLAVTVGGALVVERGGALVRTVEHAGATAGYVANWIRAFDVADLGVLNHTWSLAIEEQFYLVWPALLLLLVAVTRRPRVRAGVLAVAAVAAVLWRTEVAAALHWSFLRRYNGSDTRADGLLIGCTLGMLFHHGLLPAGEASRWVRGVSAIAGATAFAFLVHDPALVRRALHSGIVDARAVVAMATACIIWALLVGGRAWGARVLAWWPARWLGRISYGVYLYSFPLAPLITHHLRTRLHGWMLVSVHLAAFVIVAAVSYATVERAFRRRRYITASNASVTATDASTTTNGSIGAR